jgi:hypothetical protein
MSRRERSVEELAGVSTAEMSPAEYRKTDDDHHYIVTTARGTEIRVHGINSARAVAGTGGTFIREGGDRHA